MWLKSLEDLNQDPLGAAGREDSPPSVPSGTASPSFHQQQLNSHTEKLKDDRSGYILKNEHDLELKKSDISRHLNMDRVNKESLNIIKWLNASKVQMFHKCFKVPWSWGVQPKYPHFPKKVLTLLAEWIVSQNTHLHGFTQSPRGPIRPNAAASCQQVVWSCSQTSPSEVTISPSNAHNQSHPLQ